MTGQTRRQILRTLGALAVGSSLTTAVVGHRVGQRDSDAVDWHRTFGDADYQCHAVEDTHDGVLLLGRTGSGRTATPWLGEIDASGEPVWTTTLDTPGFTRAAEAVSQEDGFTILVTTDELPAIRLVKLDSRGNEQWRVPIEGPEEMADEDSNLGYASNNLSQNAQVLAESPDGYLLGGFLGHVHDSPSEATAWVRAVDTDGETLWDQSYDGTTVRDIREFDDGYLLAGNSQGDAWLQAITESGEPRWQHTYGGVKPEGASVAVPTTNGIIYGGRSDSDASAHHTAVLVQTTASGEFVWRRTQSPLHVTDLLSYGDGFVLTGEPPSEGRVGRNPDKPVIVVDRWGRVEQTATVSLDPGEPTGLGRFGDESVAVGGWDSDRGIWLAKIDF